MASSNFERNIAKVTVVLEFADGSTAGWELTDTEAAPLKADMEWKCDPERDYDAEIEQGSSWKIFKPGTRHEIVLTASGAGARLTTVD